MVQQETLWPQRVADSIVSGVPDPLLVSRLDDVIRWVLGKSGPGPIELDAAITARGIALPLARRRTLSIVARMLFRTTANPWQILGLRETAGKKEIRDRYKRLIQVFHPDKGFGEAQWSNDCVDIIRRAYAATEHSGQPTGPLVTAEQRATVEGAAGVSATRHRRFSRTTLQRRASDRRASVPGANRRSTRGRVLGAVTTVSVIYAALVGFALFSNADLSGRPEQDSAQAVSPQTTVVNLLVTRPDDWTEDADAAVSLIASTGNNSPNPIMPTLIDPVRISGFADITLRREVKRLLGEYVARYVAGDIDGMLALFPGAETPGEKKDLESLKHRMQRTFDTRTNSDLVLDVRSAEIDGDLLVLDGHRRRSFDAPSVLDDPSSAPIRLRIKRIQDELRIISID